MRNLVHSAGDANGGAIAELGVAVQLHQLIHGNRQARSLPVDKGIAIPANPLAC